jgi:hypothetical protein
VSHTIAVIRYRSRIEIIHHGVHWP